MKASFVVPELAKWDVLTEAPELLVAPFFSDERPLKGVAGLADWRLCGRLSRLFSIQRVTGEFGETTLLPASRVGFAKLVLLGLGIAQEFNEERFCSAMRLIERVAAELGSQRIALALPGRGTGQIRARRAMELCRDDGALEGLEVLLIETLAGQKDMGDFMVKSR